MIGVGGTAAGLLDALAEAAENSTVIWGFDGTLTDGEPLQAESYRVLLERWGNPTEGFSFARYVGRPEREIWPLMREDGYRLDVLPDAAAALRDSLFRDLARASPVPSGAFLLLEPIVGGVCRRQVVVSSGVPAVIDDLMGRWGLAGRIERLDTGGSKEALLRQLWAVGRTVTIEDDGRYLRLAGEAGSWRVAVRHSLNGGRGLPAEIEVGIDGRVGTAW